MITSQLRKNTTWLEFTIKIWLQAVLISYQPIALVVAQCGTLHSCRQTSWQYLQFVWICLCFCGVEPGGLSQRGGSHWSCGCGCLGGHTAMSESCALPGGCLPECRTLCLWPMACTSYGCPPPVYLQVIFEALHLTW